MSRRQSQPEAKDEKQKPDEVDRTIAAGSTIPAAKEVGRNPAETPVPALANRKLIRNAKVELEIVRFDDAIQEITALANEERGYVATSSSEKQANGKLKGEIPRIGPSGKYSMRPTLPSPCASRSG